ncbi:MAG: ABC transporter ATP-binding protein [Gemmatimonadetes bacterium]|nr:ABC transporter ATP-binding protein [Gemmatimonadota bacterium]
MPALLEVRDLRTSFVTPSGIARAVDGASFDVGTGESVALVGESGAGKSVLATSLLGLVPPPGRITGGTIRFEGHDLAALGPGSLRDLRGRRIAMIPQEPATAFDPLRRVGDQVAEVARAHGERSRAVAARRAVTMLARVGLPDPERSARSYPHELSGGMRQRVLIAMALLLEPAFVLADEPTTALDATVRAGILDLLRRLQRESGTSLLLITHDLAVVEATCTRALVMYAGQIVEDAPVVDGVVSPAHPYTRGLLASLPRIGDGRGPFRAIQGMVPAATAWPTGCRFRERCDVAIARCTIEEPLLLARQQGGAARCHLAGGGEAASPAFGASVSGSGR